MLEEQLLFPSASQGRLKFILVPSLNPSSMRPSSLHVPHAVSLCHKIPQKGLCLSGLWNAGISFMSPWKTNPIRGRDRGGSITLTSPTPNKAHPSSQLALLWTTPAQKQTVAVQPQGRSSPSPGCPLGAITFCQNEKKSQRKTQNVPNQALPDSSK